MSILIILFLSNNTVKIGLMIFVVMSFYVISLFFSKKRIISIKIHEKEKRVMLLYTKFLMIRKEEIYLFNNIRCTYKNEVGPRGIKQKQFRIYDMDNILITKITPNYMGWSDNDIEEIYDKLKQS
ncbi:hypothetical protein IWQ47_005284 [Aquimarina sp. EL_43]|nr:MULTISPECIES: hypothetical protein [unclassified Aquimarina]MBG6153947.1 hypothetical protein [Aquimarina sp. EL_32]MBG6172180.1 hypothetical protein [Aquimarina sp. EL_43]